MEEREKYKCWFREIYQKCDEKVYLKDVVIFLGDLFPNIDWDIKVDSKNV